MQPKLSEKRWAFIVNVTYFALIITLGFLFFKYALVWLMPFVIGFIFASAASPLITKITNKTNINRKVCAFFVMLFEYLVVLALFWLILSKIVGSAQSVFTNLPLYFDDTIVPLWNNLRSTFTNITKDFPPEILEHIYAFTDGAFESFRDLVSGVSEHFLSFVADATGQIPFLFLSVIFTIFSSFIISMDYDKIKNFVKKILPHRVASIISDTKLQLGKTLLGYAKSYGIIMCVTFTELLIGLAILGVENFLGIAAIIAVFDILPVLGTGGILIPWSIFQIASGHYFMGIGLVLLYIIILVVRNFVEPKIIGMHLGLHPLVTLITLYVGYRILGVIGMIALPVSVTIILSLHKTGKLNLRNIIVGADHTSDTDTTNPPSDTPPEEAPTTKAE